MLNEVLDITTDELGPWLGQMLSDMIREEYPTTMLDNMVSIGDPYCERRDWQSRRELQQRSECSFAAATGMSMSVPFSPSYFGDVLESM